MNQEISEEGINGNEDDFSTIFRNFQLTIKNYENWKEMEFPSYWNHLESFEGLESYQEIYQKLIRIDELQKYRLEWENRHVDFYLENTDEQREKEQLMEVKKIIEKEKSEGNFEEQVISRMEELEKEYRKKTDMEIPENCLYFKYKAIEEKFRTLKKSKNIFIDEETSKINEEIEILEKTEQNFPEISKNQKYLDTRKNILSFQLAEKSLKMILESLENLEKSIFVDLMFFKYFPLDLSDEMADKEESEQFRNFISTRIYQDLFVDLKNENLNG